MSTILETALAYASHGLEVFPVPPGTKKSYKSKKYSPEGKRWGATKNPDTIRSYWAEHPDANLGVPTGADNGFWVLEFDTPEGHGVDGAATLAALEAEFGPLPATRQAESPSGSVHFYFQHPGFDIVGTPGIRPGIDIRGDGNMVLAPPSIKPRVGVYKWRNDLPVADAPPWLLDLVKTATASAAAIERAPVNMPPPPPGANTAETALHTEYHRVAQAPEGTRNHQLNKSSFELGLFVGAGELDEEKAIQTLVNACEANGSFAEDAGECHATIDSGMRAGKADPVKTVSTMFGGHVSGAQGMPPHPTVESPSIAPDGPPPSGDKPANKMPGGAPGPSNPGEEEDAADEAAYPTPPGGFIQSSAQFVKGRKPPDYLIRPIFQRRYCYSITAQTDTGKTSVAMRLAAHVAIGKEIDGNVTVKKGQAVYFCGENPEDVQNRYLGLCGDMGIDPETTDVHFISGAMHISKVAKRIEREIAEKRLEPALIIVDTSAAYFETDNESDTMQALAHAKRMRSLCQWPGGPCVLVLCHPTKNARDDELIPRGGGAFLNEVDGNIALRRSGDTISGEKLGKFRGPAFAPFSFELATIYHPQIVDSDGLPMPTVVARPISGAEVVRRQEVGNNDDVTVLKLLSDQGAMKQAQVAKALDWRYRAKPGEHGKLNDKRTRTVLRRLQKGGYAAENLSVWTATPKGQKAANLVESAKPEADE